MRDATYKLGKHRVYQCVCGAKPCRPLQAEDTRARPFPTPCEYCGGDLIDMPCEITDTNLYARDLISEATRRGRL
jgi:hypothetical protein